MRTKRHGSGVCVLGAVTGAAHGAACSRGHAVGRRLLFELEGRGDASALCLRHALICPPLLRRAIPMSLAVGTICTAINHGPALLSWQLDGSLAWKVPLTYAVPFWVAITVTLLGVRRKVAPGPMGASSAQE